MAGCETSASHLVTHCFLDHCLAFHCRPRPRLFNIYFSSLEQLGAASSALSMPGRLLIDTIRMSVVFGKDYWFYGPDVSIVKGDLYLRESGGFSFLRLLLLCPILCAYCK
jgi:hypothetical protein